MKQIIKIISFFSFILLNINLFAQNVDTVNFAKHFNGFSGGFSIYNLEKDSYTKYNLEQCAKRFSPCSTFKIPNSLIGIETGILPDTSFVIKYDSLLHPKTESYLSREPFKYWFQDLSLKRAFKYSCVWYYQELARRIGTEKMDEYLNYINYGNNDISSGIDNFWLSGSLEISIDEQIEFLKKLYLNKINGFSDDSINKVKSIMLLETTPNYKLYAKTGTGDYLDGKVIAWFVGFVETESGTNIFALNLIVNSFDDLKNNYRVELTKKILRELNIINF